jgi:hypothetical protein
VATPPLPQLEALEVGHERQVAGKPEGLERLVRRLGVMKEKRCLYAPQEIGMLQRQREYERI